MAISTTTSTTSLYGRKSTDYRAMSIATTLFFMWGFLTCMNDILIPHLKSIFELSIAEAALIQTAFFGSYFLFAIPAGKLVEYRGYKQTMVIGLIVAAAGAVLFIPAAHLASYPLFLAAQVVLAAGITGLQVSANPFVASVGPTATASSRLNLSQAFNSLGTTIAPWIGRVTILAGVTAMSTLEVSRLSDVQRVAYRAQEASTVTMPYLVITGILLVLAALLASVRLDNKEHMTVDYRPIAGFGASVWNQPWLLAGAVGIFVYVGAEVSIGSFLIGYFGQPGTGSMTAVQAAGLVPYYWGGAMIGRFIGSAVLQRVRTGTLLGLAGAVACALVLTSVFTHGNVAVYTILGVGFFNSIMFPCIFALGLTDLGELTSKGSSLLVQAIVGGALIPYLYGKVADHVGYQQAFIIPAVCYVYIAIYGFAANNRKPMYPSLPKEMI
ncbi:glucose/galactose transporter [Terriglobus roseus DSM 18391]|uniref:Glucose/galactose transporter n=2 Tax=Terriglobus roseus TaxID=392734 RepID=I3ZM71_TERRK|nr:glucose/galactose transporter [Terriglobus roseus DSM 18391]